MWQYRELIKNLVVADLKNRYRNNVLGFLWSFLNPLLLSLVLYFVFRNVFKQEENFVLNVLTGVIAYRFFSIGTMSCLSAVLSKPSLITKVNIPRRIPVLSTALVSLVGATLEFIVVIPIAFILAHGMPITALLFPVIHLLHFWLIYGIGLLLSALFVYLRDLNEIWQVLITVLFYCIPIFYPVSIVPEHIRQYYLLNPITQLIIMYRDVMINGTLPSLNSLITVIAFGAIAFLIGNFAFARLQRRFAEEI